jgi:PAS domain S-box-containing protein
MTTGLTPSGIGVIGDIPWGVHFSLFYETPTDLLDAIVPYFAAGLEAGQLCLWAPTVPSVEEEVIHELRGRVPDFDDRLRKGDLNTFRYEDLFIEEGVLDVERALAEYKQWEQRGRSNGYTGLRAAGNLSWIDSSSWPTFAAYERTLHDWAAARRMLVLCSYPLAHIGASDVFDLARAHDFVIARREGEWEVLETPELKRTKDDLRRLNEKLEERVSERTSELATANQELHEEIGERQRVESSLRRSETYLELGQRLSHTGSYAADPVAREFTFWSEETFRIFGLEPSTHPLTRLETYAAVHPADRERVQLLNTSGIIDEREAEFEFRIVRPDGDIRHVYLASRPVVDESGRFVEVVGSMMDITERRRAAARLAKAKRVARERTLEHRFAATLDERTRLAREIHDSLLQQVTGIALQLRATLPNLGNAPQPTVDSIRHIVELADSTIRDARQAVWDIRAPALAQKGLLVALEEEARKAASGIHIDFSVSGTPRTLSPPVEDTFFRIGQEAVVNAAKHSAASSISVVLAYRPRSVRLTVVDDGRGFCVDQLGRTHGGRWGLLGMRERAKRIGASIVIHSSEGKGTTVELCARNVRKQATGQKQGSSPLERAS